jgi:hypothetical protein
MTRIDEPLVTTEAAQNALVRKAMLAAALSAVATYMLLVAFVPEVKAVINPSMEVACGTWPRYPGEHLTVVVTDDGRLNCWNNLHRRDFE